MTYDLNFTINTSGPLVLAQGINQNANNAFGGILLVFVFLIMMISLRKQGFQDAFLASSFITSIISGLLWGVDLLYDWQLALPVSFLVLGIIIKVWADG